MSSITSAQIRGACGMLDWSKLDLAKAARLSVSTVKRVGDGGTPTVSPLTVGQIQGALEAAGVEFLGDEGRGSGLRLRLRQASLFSRFL